MLRRIKKSQRPVPNRRFSGLGRPALRLGRDAAKRPKVAIEVSARSLESVLDGMSALEAITMPPLPMKATENGYPTSPSRFIDWVKLVPEHYTSRIIASCTCAEKGSQLEAISKERKALSQHHQGT